MIYAYDSNNVKTHILDVETGHEYHCKDCGDRLVPMRGELIAWHFNHNTNNSCKTEPNIGCIVNLKQKDRNICNAVNKCDKTECRFKKGV